MSLRYYFMRVLFPIMIVFLFYLVSLLISDNDSKDRALLLLVIGHCYGIAICSSCWFIFKLIGPVFLDSVKRDIITTIFIAAGLYFIMTANDKQTTGASVLYIIANVCAAFLSRKP